jgi:hypothetical protein
MGWVIHNGFITSDGNQGLRVDNRASLSATRPLPSSGAMRSQSFTNVAVLLPRHHLRVF